MKAIIEYMRGLNPYPEDLFTPIKDKELKAIVKLLQDNGHSSDCLFGNWGRKVWNNCISKLESELSAHEAEEKEKCYVLLSDEEIENKFPYSLSYGNYCRQEGTKWFRSQLKEGYPKEFILWLFFGNHPFVQWYDNVNEYFFSDELDEKKWTLDELYQYWKTEIVVRDNKTPTQ